MSISLDLLRSFLAVHRAGSITGGAELLGLAQPTVTTQLRALEAGLGRPLFTRHARGVTATTFADELARRAADHIDALDTLVLDEGPDPYPTVVHLGGPAEFLNERVLPALCGMVADGLQLRITHGLPDDLLAGVADGRLDLTISSVRPRSRALTVTALGDEEFVLAASPRWAARIGSPVDPDTLGRVPLVAYAAEAPIVRRYWRTVFGVRLTRTPELVVPDLRGVRTALVAHAGVSVLPTYLCAPQLADGSLVALLRPELPPLNTLFIAGRQAIMGRRAVAAVRRRLLEADLLGS